MCYSFTATPGPPINPTIKDVGATWVCISWTAPLVAGSPISRYEVIARSLDNSQTAGMVTVSTKSSVTAFNATGLLPGTAYELSVVAVSQGGDVIAKSPESEPAQATTEVTGICILFFGVIRLIIVMLLAMHAAIDFF